MSKVDDYKIIAFTHRNVHLNEIGQYVLPDLIEDACFQRKLNQIKQHTGIQELMYLATCNRIMFFFTTEHSLDNPAFQEVFFKAAYDNFNVTAIQKACKQALYFEGLSAIQHLFEVASSMDSLVVGEREILRQLREAYHKNHDLGLCGDSIRIAIRHTVETAKKVYSSTRIGEKPVSVVSLAIQKLLQAQVPTNARFLLIGAGETNRLVLKFLQKYNYQYFAIFNRSLNRAEDLAAVVQGTAHGLEDLSTYTAGFDVIIAATGATQAIVNLEIYQQLLGADAENKLIIDLSIPNNVEPAIAKNFNTTYIPIESLKDLANQNLAFREKEVTKAREVVKEYVNIFHTAFEERQIERALIDVPIQIKAIRHHALNNVFKQEVAALDDNSKELIERMMAYMEKRCIAIPIQVAKEKLVEK